MAYELAAGSSEVAEVDSLYDERRLIDRVLSHWTEIAMARGLPRLRDVDPWMLGDDWTNCLLVAVQSPLEHSHFVTLGQNLLPPSSPSLAGAAIALCSTETLAGILVANLPRVLPARRCLIVEGGAVHRGAAILYRSALLPLAENGIDVDHVLGAANHRRLRPDEAADPVISFTWSDGGKMPPGFEI
jgi:hypothetical protein